MGSAVAIAFFAVLALLTLVAGRTWYERRGAAVDQARERVFRRFVLGLIVFWMLAVSWFLWAN
jgi:membrane protein implicated in regulation of membrane protease activity